MKSVRMWTMWDCCTDVNGEKEHLFEPTVDEHFDTEGRDERLSPESQSIIDSM